MDPMNQAAEVQLPKIPMLLRNRKARRMYRATQKRVERRMMRAAYRELRQLRHEAGYRMFETNETEWA